MAHGDRPARFLPQFRTILTEISQLTPWTKVQGLILLSEPVWFQEGARFVRCERSNQRTGSGATTG